MIRHAPLYARALLTWMQFGAGESPSASLVLREPEWRRLLSFCDRNQLTLLLADLLGCGMPEWVRLRINNDYSKQERRLERVQSTVENLAGLFQGKDIPFVLLKGFGNSHEFVRDPVLRAQGDIDVWCPGASVYNARAALVKCGYYAVGEGNARHLAPMIHERNWNWSGDYFQADLPIPIDLHHRLWDGDAEGIAGPDETTLWNRKTSIRVGDKTVRVLDLPDSLAFAALHLFMHILHGDLRLGRAWEIAYFLRGRCGDEDFWAEWRSRFEGPTIASQLIVFALVDKWFACGNAPSVIKGIAELPRGARLWLERFGWSPVEALFSPNKDEIWLHLSFLKSREERVRLLWRRLIPLQQKISSIGRVDGRSGAQMKVLCRRTYHHAVTLGVSIVRGLSWWRMRRISA